MQYLNIHARNRLFITFLVLFTFCRFSDSHAQVLPNTDLKINLFISDERILIYAGKDLGLQAGQRFAVIRNNAQVGMIELTEVRYSTSIARVIARTQDIHNYDLLVPVGTFLERSGMRSTYMESDIDKPIIADPEADKKKKKTKDKTSPAPTTKDKKSDEKKTDVKKKKSKAKTSSRTKSKKSKKEKAPKAKKSRSSSKKKKVAKKESKKKDPLPKAPEPKEPIDPRVYAYPTNDGFSGLWTIPTTDVIPKGKVAFSYYHGWYGISNRYVDYTKPITTSIGSYLDMENSQFSVTYGITDRVEITGSKNEVSLETGLITYGLPTNYNVRETSEGNGHTIGVKYNPGKRYILDETTHKKWTYAIGAQDWESEEIDGSYYFAVVSAAMDKFDVHLGIFHYDYEGLKGKKLGTMAGLELPISQNSIFIGEARLFQSDYTYNLAVRYIYRKRNSLLLGLSDATDMRIKELGFSYIY